MDRMMQTGLTSAVDVSANLRGIQARISAAATRARRDPAGIQLVAVTKSGRVDQIYDLIRAGHRGFGESRVQQLQIRATEVKAWLERPAEESSPSSNGIRPAALSESPIEWHMIGHLQTNKAAAAVTYSNLIHSVDSLRLVELLGEIGVRRGIRVPILLEVNTTDDPDKYGMPPMAAFHVAEETANVPGLKFMGLMTMARHTDNPEEARPAFVRLRELFEDIAARKTGGPHFKQLSMGMSGDFEVAVEEGSTIVRIGSALFAPGVSAEAAKACQ